MLWIEGYGFDFDRFIIYAPRNPKGTIRKAYSAMVDAFDEPSMMDYEQPFRADWVPDPKDDEIGHLYLTSIHPWRWEFETIHRRVFDGENFTTVVNH